MFTSHHETPLSQDYNEIPKKRTIVINEIESKTDKIYDLHEYVQSLATEVKAMKLLLKKEFCFTQNVDLEN